MPEAIEDPTLGPGEAEKMSRGSLSMVFYGLVSAMFFVYIGASLALAYGTRDALTGLVLTIIAYGAINHVLSGYAMRNGVTVAQFSRSILGRSGSILATVIFAATAIYYSVFEGTIVAFAFQAQFGGDLVFWYALVVLYSTPLVIPRARKFLDRINGWLLPIYWGGLVIAVVWAGMKYGFKSDWINHTVPPLDFVSGGPGWLAAFSAYLGVWILMMYTMDFASLGRKEDARFHQRWTFGTLFYVFAFGVNALVGIFLTFTIPGLQATETGVAGGMVSLMGIFGLLVVFVSQTRINTANYYLSATNLQQVGQRVLRLNLPPVFWTLLASAIIFLLMLLPVVETLLLMLAWQGVLVTGWVAIAMTHIVMDRKDGRSLESGEVPDAEFSRINVPGVAAWLISAAVGIAILQSGVSWGASLGTIMTPLLAAGLYAAMRAVTNTRTAYRPQAAYQTASAPAVDSPQAIVGTQDGTGRLLN